MRMNIVFDDKLMAEALRTTGFQTKKEAIQGGVKILIKLRKQANIRSLSGKLN